MLRPAGSLVFTGVLAFFGLSAVCAAQTPAVIAQQLYTQVNQAYAQGDLNRLLTFMDERSYLNLDPQGKPSTIQQFRNDAQQVFTLTRQLNMTTDVKDAHLQGTRLVTYVTNAGHYQLQDPGLGWVPLVINSSSEDTWQRKPDGQWKLIVSKSLHKQAHVDPAWMAAQLKQQDGPHKDMLNKFAADHQVLEQAQTPVCTYYKNCR